MNAHKLQNMKKKSVFCLGLEQLKQSTQDLTC